MTCPLCGQVIAIPLRRLVLAVEASAAQRIQKEHPGWKPEAGACPQCAQRAAEAVRRQRSWVTPEEQFLSPDPLPGGPGVPVIPAYRRLNADPSYSGQGVTLAFLDSGFYPHPDLTRPKNRILCYVDASRAQPVETMRFPRPQSSSWHGMMTACVAAGNGFKSGGYYRGLAYRASLVLVKTGNPARRGIREADIQRALAWVIANRDRFNIRVVNISLGGDHPANGRLTPLDRLVEQATAQGMTVVAAIGNDGIERLVPPASAPAAISVGGLDDRNSLDRARWRMYRSNYGRCGEACAKPEVIAPAAWLAAPMLPRSRLHSEGMLLWQLDQAMEQLERPGGMEAAQAAPAEENTLPRWSGVRQQIRQRMLQQKYIHPHYQHVDGTSMAAPLVSAVVALMLEANPGLTPALVKEILRRTAVAVEGLPPERQGAGVVDAGRAVAAARRASRGALEWLPFSPHLQSGMVNFYYFDPLNRAARVSLIGSFNGWNPEGYELRSRSPGLWQIAIPLPPPGVYSYKFLRDDGWTHDPENPNRAEDGYGGFNSLLEIVR